MSVTSHSIVRVSPNRTGARKVAPASTTGTPRMSWVRKQRSQGSSIRANSEAVATSNHSKKRG